MTHVAVIDIGKTNAKLALVDPTTGAEVAVVTRPNTVLQGPPYPHFDIEAHWRFLTEALGQFHRSHGIDAISVTTHGASAALLDAQGNLAVPVLDYEYGAPAQLRRPYDQIRPDFAQTGSAPLDGGLNLGLQLYWQFRQDPSLHARTHTIVTYPQYWGFRLTGAVATDVTSLGCHTDLWCPDTGQFSSLVDKLDIRDKIAPPRKSTDRLGILTKEVAALTGLPAETPVTCGIHDSNASLYPHLIARTGPFAIVSTGTWVIAMAIGGAAVALDPARDTLINVDATGNPVRSARFMGGRSFDLLMPGESPAHDEAAQRQVLQAGIMLMPAVVQGTGPFPDAAPHWLGHEPSGGSPQRAVAVGFYLAMMTATCLDLIGAGGPVIVEGAFTKNLPFLRMLAAATGRPVQATTSSTGTSLGAALLAAPEGQHPPAPSHIAPITEDSSDWLSYAARWRAAAQTA